MTGVGRDTADADNARVLVDDGGSERLLALGWLLLMWGFVVGNGTCVGRDNF